MATNTPSRQRYVAGGRLAVDEFSVTVKELQDESHGNLIVFARDADLALPFHTLVGKRDGVPSGHGQPDGGIVAAERRHDPEGTSTVALTQAERIFELLAQPHLRCQFHATGG